REEREWCGVWSVACEMTGPPGPRGDDLANRRGESIGRQDSIADAVRRIDPTIAGPLSQNWGEGTGLTDSNHFFRLNVIVNIDSLESPMNMSITMVSSSFCTVTIVCLVGLPSGPGPSPVIVSAFFSAS